MKVMCVGTVLVDILTAPIATEISAGQGVETPIALHPGGNAFNVSVDLVRLGVEPRNICCIGAVGEDAAGALVRDALKTHGVEDRLPRVRNGRTGKCIILNVEDEERTFIFDKGASQYLGANDVIRAIERYRPDIFYIGEIGALGNVNEHLPSVLRSAKDNGAITFVDYVILDGHDPDKLFESALLIDVLHCNDFEAEVLTEQRSPYDAAMVFHHRGFRLTFVSQGDGELICTMYGRQRDFMPFQVDCQDSTGAGDAFVAGLMAQLIATNNKESVYWLNEQTLYHVVRYAMAAGAAAVTEFGCTSGVSERAVQEIIDAEDRRRGRR